MFKFVLVVWLILPDNYAVHTEFNSQAQCIEKKQQLDRALKQAESKMQTECRKVWFNPSALGAEDREFESLHSDQYKKKGQQWAMAVKEALRGLSR